MSNFVVIGRVNQTDDDKILIEYEAVAGTREAWVPKGAITQQQSLGDGRTVFSLQAGSGYTPSRQFNGVLAPSVIESMDIEIVAALESGEELPESTDEVPAWDVGIDIESMLVVVEDGEEIDESVWTNSLFAAGRISDACDWRFRPRVLPAFVPVEEGNSRGGMAARMARVNNKQGDATQFHIFNPNFESDKEPAGAHLGCVSGRYLLYRMKQSYNHCSIMLPVMGGNQVLLLIIVVRKCEWIVM